MNRSYLGLVTPRGLEAIYPEDKHVIRLLNRRVLRKRPDSCLCWAVLSDEVLDFIEQQLAAGEHRLAFCTMQAHADFCGSILPSHADGDLRETEAMSA